MKISLTLSLLSVALFSSLFSTSAFAADGGATGVGGGGDLCENRIKVIRDDIKSWIQKGGPVGLSLPAGISVEQYVNQMLTKLDSSKIRCVGSNDSGYPVTIEGTPKVCRFDLLANESRITCDMEKFNSLDESGQYVLVHHEFAGLANVEAPNKDDSNYAVSNQISEYLVDVVVKKLAIKPASERSVTLQYWTTPFQMVSLANEATAAFLDHTGLRNLDLGVVSWSPGSNNTTIINLLGTGQAWEPNGRWYGLYAVSARIVADNATKKVQVTETNMTNISNVLSTIPK